MRRKRENHFILFVCFLFFFDILDGKLVPNSTFQSSEIFEDVVFPTQCGDEKVRLKFDAKYKNIEESNHTIHITVLLPFDEPYPFSLFKLRPSSQILQTLFQRHLPCMRIILTYRNSECSEPLAMHHAVLAIMEGKVAAFLGPVCDFAEAPIAREVAFWHLPIISIGAISESFMTYRKQTYSTLTRTGPVNLKSLARGLRSFLERYKWKRTYFLYSREAFPNSLDNFCHFVADYLVKNWREKGNTNQNNFTNPSSGEQKVWPVSLEYYKINEKEKVEEEVEYVLTKKIGADFAVIMTCLNPNFTQILLKRAEELGFNNGEYVFINIDLFSSKKNLINPWMKIYDNQNNSKLNDFKKENSKYKINSLKEIKDKKKSNESNFSNIYGSLFTVTIPNRPEETSIQNFIEFEETSFKTEFYDTLLLYSIVVNETLGQGLEANNGREVTRRMRNRTFKGLRGPIRMDENGDRTTSYCFMDLNWKEGVFQTLGIYNGGKDEYKEFDRLHLFGNSPDPPPDHPKCGYHGLGCLETNPFPPYAIVITLLWSVMLITIIITVLVYRHYKFEAELEESKWRVRWGEVVVGGGKEGRTLEKIASKHSLARKYSSHSLASVDTLSCRPPTLKQMFITTGSYKSIFVAIKKLNQPITISKSLLLLIKKMRDLENDHVVRFVGVCIDVGHQCLLTEYCQKGSLMDVLENEQIGLDYMFKFSLIQDIIRGMCYIHNSELKCHGNLKSSNCLVDSRFVVKVADYGVKFFKTKEENDEEDKGSYAYYKARLWTAPELLRMAFPPLEGTQKGDVYSFGIICQEVLCRSGTFWVQGDLTSPQEIIELVKKGGKTPYRPSLSEELEFSEGCEELLFLVRRCWAEEPGDRYDFNSIKGVVKRINKKVQSAGNLLDNLLLRMEQYATNLESLVEERTSDYLEEKKKAEDLLYLMLPRSVATQLMRGERVEAEKFDSVTIYFSDICGFTALSAESTPMQIVDLLNDLYTTFDQVIDLFDVYKVETIGDAYMVVSGLPLTNETRHAREVARMALSLLKAVKSFRIRHKPDAQLNLRIGIHSGPVCAGVVGKKMPRYCLFGDTVNTASRMESNGLPLKIHVSPQTKQLLDLFKTFVLELRGAVNMKGKGDIVTWWLLGEENSNFSHLSPPPSFSIF